MNKQNDNYIQHTELLVLFSSPIILNEKLIPADGETIYAGRFPLPFK